IKGFAPLMGEFLQRFHLTADDFDQETWADFVRAFFDSLPERVCTGPKGEKTEDLIRVLRRTLEKKYGPIAMSVGGSCMLVAMAGLPSTGKTTLAVRLASELGGIVLSKDTVRAALFPFSVLDYSQGQDDLCMAAIYQAAAQILKSHPEQVVIIDGRTFSRPYQVNDLLDLARSVRQTPI